MSVFPIGSTTGSMLPKLGNPYNSEAMAEKWPGEPFSQFKGLPLLLIVNA